MKNSNRIWHIYFKVFILLIILFFPRLSCIAKEQKVMRVGFLEVPGYTMVTEDGEHYGVVVDFLNEIAKYTGWRYEFVQLNEDSIMEDFVEKECDLMGGAYYLEACLEYFGYPDYNCGYNKMFLLALKEDDSIKTYDYGTFNGKTIGVYENSKESIRLLEKYLAAHNIECELKYYTYEEFSKTGTLYRFLENGDVDMLLGNVMDLHEDFYVAAAYDSQPHYIVTNAGNREVLDELNKVLKKIYDADANFARKVYNANFSSIETGYASLNAEELEYIRQKKEVKVAIMRQWYPFFRPDNSESYNGIVPDIMKKIKEYSGLEYSFIACDDYVEAVEKVKSGEADILGVFADSEEAAIEQGLAKTAFFSEISPILVRNKDSSYPAEGLIGATLEGRQIPKTIAVDEVRYYSDVAKALSDVNKGKVDFLYGVSSHVEQVMQRSNFTNIVQVNLTDEDTQISFALKRPVQQELFSILNKAINNLTIEQKETIRNQNTVSIARTKIPIVDIIYSNPVLTILIIAAFMFMLMIIVIQVSNYRLRSVAMHNQLEKAAAESKAKSEFLSRMSHEIRTPMNAIMGLTDLTGMMEDLPEKAKENLSKIKSSSQYLLRLISDILDMSRIENDKMEIVREPFSLNAMVDEIGSIMTVEAQRRNLDFQIDQKISHDAVLGDNVRLCQVIINLLSNAFKFTPAGGEVRLCIEEELKEDEVLLNVQVIDNGVGIADKDQERIFQSFEQVGANITKSQGTGLGLAISNYIVRLMGGQLKLISQPGEGSVFYFEIALPWEERVEGKSNTMPHGKADFKGCQILLAEDNDLNAEIASGILEMQGAVVSRAKNGKEALKMFEASPVGTIQLILMDIQMPEMNGLEAARAIRSFKRPDAEAVLMIAMTANTFEKDKKEALEAGMTGFISKPIDARRLTEELQKALQSRTDEKEFVSK